MKQLENDRHITSRLLTISRRGTRTTPLRTAWACGREDICGDDFIQQAGKLTVGERHPVQGLERFAEVVLHRGSVGDVRTIVVLQAPKIADEPRFDAFLTKVPWRNSGRTTGMGIGRRQEMTSSPFGGGQLSWLMTIVAGRQSVPPTSFMSNCFILRYRLERCRPSRRAASVMLSLTCLMLRRMKSR